MSMIKAGIAPTPSINLKNSLRIMRKQNFSRKHFLHFTKIHDNKEIILAFHITTIRQEHKQSLRVTLKV